MITVDTRGTLCPQPLILTKRAMDAQPAQTLIEVIYDNETAKCNLLSFLLDFQLTPEEGTNSEGLPVIRFTTQSEGKALASAVAESDINCPLPTAPTTQTTPSRFVVAIKSDRMGSGDDKLGTILLRAFVNTLPELDTLPSYILLYNSGIKIALEGADTVETLKRMEQLGVTIIACGTCLDYYEVKEQLAVGRIGNMMLIAETMIAASSVVYP